MAVNKLRVARDQGVDNPDVLLIKNVPEYVDHVVLVANVVSSYTVPAGATVVLFSSTVPFYVKPNADPAIPSVAVTNGTGADYNPTGYYLINLDGVSTPGTAITTLRFISSSAGVVTIVVHKQGPANNGK